MSRWSLRKLSRKHKEQREKGHPEQFSEPLSQQQTQQTLPNIIVGGETPPAEQLGQRKKSEPHKEVRVLPHHRTSTTSTESEGYGSREASSSSLPRVRSSSSSLQGIPEELFQSTTVSPKSLHKNVSNASVSSTSSYHTTLSNNTRHSPTSYLEPTLPEEHLQKAKLEELEKLCQESKEERAKLETRIAELEARVNTLELQTHVVSPKASGEKNCKDTLPVNLPVSQNVIIALAKRIPRWKFLARYLDFKEHEIQRIHDDHQGDVQEQCFQMLWKWKQASLDGGDYPSLGEAVRKDLGDSFYSEFVKLVTEIEERSLCSSLC